jgi:pSer/pThr/pTyr-binding forkhead associated (FHA) protein
VTENAPYLVDCAGRRFPFAGPVVTLGRSHDCDVHVPDKRASRRHAEIHWDGESSTLRDLNSANGTFLDGRRITTPQTLRDGNEIVIASAVFTFRDPESTIRVAEIPLLVVGQDSGEIWVNRNPVSLSLKEQALFDLLYQSAGCVCPKQKIAQVVWPEYQAEVYDYQIESLVKRLREKLEPDPRAPVLVVTVRGQGYKLAATVSRTLA